MVVSSSLLPPSPLALPHRGGLLVAGERSGVGKTTVTLAILAALGQRSQRVQSFKVGPDYIDPMFHQRVTGRPCYNLDPVLTSPAYLQECFTRHCEGAEFVLVEGVMGLFDGASGLSEVASSAQVAKLLNLPVVLVVDCGRLARSVLAIVHGFRHFDADLQLAGVVLNRVASDRHREILSQALGAIDLPILGMLPRQTEITIPDRHLGLVPTAELPGLATLVDQLADFGRHHLDWAQLEPLLRRRSGPNLPSPAPPTTPDQPPPVRIALAQDAAFSFYYADALEFMTHLGVDWVPWSPLRDETLPEEIDGLYLGGGFPEMFAPTLAANLPLHRHLQRRIGAGLPTYAECGGLMYLAQSLGDLSGQDWPMLGILPTRVGMGHSLTVGYRQASGLHPASLVPPGCSVWGHEFHHSQASPPPAQPLYALRRYDADQSHGQEGWQVGSVQASYLHLHWAGCPGVAQGFVDRCHRHRQRQDWGQ